MVNFSLARSGVFSSKSLFFIFLILLSHAFACGNAKYKGTPKNPVNTQQEKTGNYIVVLKEDSGQDPATMAEEIETTHNVSKKFVYSRALRGFSIKADSESVERLNQDPRVDYIVVDKPLSTFATQQLPINMDRIDVERTATYQKKAGQTLDIDIAIIDSGIDLDHPDLNVYKEKSVSFVEDDSGGNDAFGHGTHVAGIAAALNNDIGVVGVAAGARLWSVKVVSDDGKGYTSNVIAGIEYVTQHADEIEVANMSLGGNGSSDGNCGRTNKDPYHTAVCNSVAAGVVYVVAAGNGSADAANTVPASFEEVITVSAIADSDGKPGGKGAATDRGDDDAFASFSNFGQTVDIAAPGVNVLSTYLEGSTKNLSGTSMASPHVAGAVALYILNNFDQRPTDTEGKKNYANLIKSKLIEAATKKGSEDYFKNDPDNYAEPLLNLAKLDPYTVSNPEIPTNPGTPGSPDPTQKSIHVASTTQSIKTVYGYQSLYVVVEVRDNQNNLVQGVSVSIQVDRNGAYYVKGTGKTSSSGKVGFYVLRPKAGSYKTKVTEISKTGYVWDQNVSSSSSSDESSDEGTIDFDSNQKPDLPSVMIGDPSQN